MVKYIKYFLFAPFLWTSVFLQAQELINKDEAIKIAITNNGKVRTEAKKVGYQNALVNTAYSFEPTQVTAEMGQFNSTYFDTGLGISQSFNLPQVYKKRANAQRQQVKTAEAYLRMSEAELRQQLEELFIEYLYLEAKERLLKNQDSLFSGFLQRSIIRWQKGETDILEKTTAEQQKLHISQQLVMLSKMKEFLQIQLEYLLNDDKKYIPETKNPDIIKNLVFYDSLTVQKHPGVLAAEQEVQLTKAKTEAAKTDLLPRINVGYRNVSIRGTGADNQVYQGGDRFSSFQVGVGIPLFRKGSRAAIQSSQMMEEIKVEEYEDQKLYVDARIRQQYVLYAETMDQLMVYEQKALPNSRTIRAVSENQFSNGQINYLEYVMLMQQSFMIESEYLELTRNLNKYSINLKYLTGNH